MKDTGTDITYINRNKEIVDYYYGPETTEKKTPVRDIVEIIKEKLGGIFNKQK